MALGDDNPYRDALVGLEIEDPVDVFFAWCIERERIRSKRDAGEPPPWTDDPIFQNGRFLNVFREDDKGTKAVLCFADPVKKSVSDLIHALFFARWCNQHITLLALEPRHLKKPEKLRHALMNEVPQPWASEVYPVVSAHWEGHAYDRLEACVEMFPQCVDFLESCIRLSGGNVMQANDSINAQFQMSNDFPIFMALVDLALFRPDLISSDSPVPTGIGAAPYLDLLQRHLGCVSHQETADKMIALQSTYWPQARRKFTPIDIEYLSCECRKYFSTSTAPRSLRGRIYSPRLRLAAPSHSLLRETKKLNVVLIKFFTSLATGIESGKVQPSTSSDFVEYFKSLL